MSEVSLGRLAVVMCTMADGSVGRSNSELAAVKFVSGSIPVFCSFVYNLVESWEDIVSELHFGDGSGSTGGCTDCKACNALF